ncbi:MAG: hypothetical protein ABR936_15565 [Bacteroidota bacterium]|jgi:hypothetical protein
MDEKAKILVCLLLTELDLEQILLEKENSSLVRQFRMIRIEYRLFALQQSIR